MKVVLSIAGSDSSGGAGIQADLKTMTAHKVYGMTAITALTAQNTTGVTDILEASPEFLGEQIEACLSDIPCDAAKIGMLPSAEQVKVVHEKLTKYKVKNLVVDPVMVATSGSSLMKDSTAEVMARLLFPISRVITPNIPEAQALTGLKITSRKDMEKAAEELGNECGCAVLLKGGHSIEDINRIYHHRSDKGSCLCQAVSTPGIVHSSAFGRSRLADGQRQKGKEYSEWDVISSW